MAKRFEKIQIDVLKDAFEESESLDKAKKIQLARITGLDMEQVSSWFNRMRASKRSRECTRKSKQINAELKKSLQQSKDREAKLENELKESKQRQAEIETENQRLKDRIANAEDDQL